MATRNRRLLLCGPAFPVQAIDGLQDVLRDLTAGLRSRGWLVDTLLWPADYGDVPQPMQAGLEGWADALGRTSRLIRLPDSVRLAVRIAVHDRRDARQASAILDRVESRIATGGYDVVLACLDTAPLGLASLVTRAHPRPILQSLSALGRELRGRRMLAVAHRRLGRFRGPRWHRDLFHAVDPARIPHAVFGSDAWRDEAVAAGLSETVTSTTYFGVPCADPLEAATPPRSPARLLWAARLSPEKGLHIFLPALARLRDRLPFHLTVITGLGAAAYRTRIDRLVRALALENAVTFQAPVERSRLHEVLAAHDALLFMSPFHAPVAQMLLRAFAGGLVVVGPRSRDDRSILQPDRTAFCFSDPSPPSIARTIERALTDLDVRRAVRARAFELVRTSQSLDITITRYDALLSRVLKRQGAQSSS